MDKSDSERESRAQARLEEEGVMGWVKPAFDEIKDGRGGEVLQRRNHLVNAAPERAVNIRVRPPLTDRGHRAHAAPGRERGERHPSAGKTRAIPDRRWRPHRDSNSGYRRERAVSWASRRWGRRRARLAQLHPAVHSSEL